MTYGGRLVIRRLVYATVTLSALLIVLWVFNPSNGQDESSLPSIKLRPPELLAQSSNFPEDYAGIARYIKHDAVDFSDIHRAVSEVADDVKETDGTSYVWATMSPRDTSWPIYDLYADVDGWVILFLPRLGTGRYDTAGHMFARGWKNRVESTTSLGSYGNHTALAFKSTSAMLRFNSALGHSFSEGTEKVYNSSFHHFAYPLANTIYVANKKAGRWTAEFSFFVPNSVTVHEVTTEFWVYQSSGVIATGNDFLSIDGIDVHREVDEDVIYFHSHTFGTGHHSVQLEEGVVTIVIVAG